MAIALKTGVSFCVVDGTAIFLDLAADRYFTLSKSANLHFLRTIAEESPVDALSRFPFLHFSADGDAPTVAPAEVQACERSLVDEELPPVSGLSVLRAAADQMRASVILRRRPLYAVLLAERDTRPSRASTTWNEDQARGIAASYQAAGRLVGLTDRCLRLSFAMWCRMSALGWPVNLVFGVTNRPFAAHCWVQSSDTVCSDRLEHVRWFTPIAVL